MGVRFIKIQFGRTGKISHKGSKTQRIKIILKSSCLGVLVAETFYLINPDQT
ncbi:hypothetical protein D1AOALGA4SA_9303 [Olavius algarvensis Delta 1 endosymbiont]|nr:hypothetical protein D1AOALGA4SA_9303 [Olavius algarvensis Delta 1 endosymbiont]